MNISALSTLLNLATTNPNEAKALTKLLSIDVLKSLGDGKYLIGEKNSSTKNNLMAQSDKPLMQGERYWIELSHGKNNTLKIQNYLKQPPLFKELRGSSLEYSLKDLQTILSSKNPQSLVKQNLLEQLAATINKDEFTNIASLLLSIQNQTLTIPLNYQGYFSVLQFKKRYNKQNKKTAVDFYALFEFLGPISGLIWLDEGDISVELGVAFERSKQFLENNMKHLSYSVKISLLEKIKPLYNITSEYILDVSI